MIEKIDNAAQAIKLFNVDDDIDQYFSGERGDIVQWIVSHIANPKIRVWANYDMDGEIDSYLIVQNGIAPPISNAVQAIYIWSPVSTEITTKLVNNMKEWQREIGATSIRAITTHSPELFERYGFKSIATVVEFKDN